MARQEQRWILDTLLGSGGIDVLHPNAQGIFEQFGYDHADIAEVFSRANAASMMTKAWESVGLARDRRFRWAVEEGFERAAAGLALRAALLYGRAQYTILADTARKRDLHGRCIDLYAEVSRRTPTRVERIEIPFGDRTVYVVLHLPDTDAPAPCLLMIPGMDMFKEEWHQFAQRWAVPQGLAAVSIDGPGQGETRLNGLTVDLTNYEEAVSAVIDHLVTLPEVDEERIGVLGISMGSYWATRIAAHDRRVKAAATALSCHTLEGQVTIFTAAQPKFINTFMYMSGITDEDQFTRTFVEGMGLGDVLDALACPVLLVAGEFDELTPTAETVGVYDRITAPKELWVYEDEFHPLGSVAGELLPIMVDWVLARLGGAEPIRDRRLFIDRAGQAWPDAPVLTAHL